MRGSTGVVLAQVTALYRGLNTAGEPAAQWTVDVRTPGGRPMTCPVLGSRAPRASGWVLVTWLNENDLAPVALPLPAYNATGHAGHELIDDYDSGVQIRVTAGGELRVNASSGRAITVVPGGANDKPRVELAGGDARAAREGDTVDANESMAAWMAWVDAAIQAVAVAAGAVIPPSPGAPGTMGGISSGSDNVGVG
jgi:hypothetical protein